MSAARRPSTWSTTTLDARAAGVAHEAQRLAVEASPTRALPRGLPPGQPGCLVLDLNMPGMSGSTCSSYLKEQGVACR
jgi:FixJ family two-component response regulator